MKLKRATSVIELLQKKIEVLEFEGNWFDAFDKPEARGTWFIWGNSGNGKTRFTLELCKYLTRFGNVAYNSLEEGESRSMQKAFNEIGMIEVKGKLTLLCEDLEVLDTRLSKKKSPDIVVIDSLQYTDLNYIAYKKYKARHRNKLTIFISHAEGKQPDGRTAKKVMFDAALKIWVEGYRAFTKGRSIGKKGYYTIWDKGAEQYWGEEITNHLNSIK